MRYRVPIFIMTLMLVHTIAHAQLTIVPDTSRRLSVDGVGVVEGMPDRASVSLGIQVVDKSLVDAKKKVDTILSDLIALARSLDVEDARLQTNSVNVEPDYKGEDRSEFAGYIVTRELDVELHDLSKIEPLLDGAVAARANRDFFVSLSSSRREEMERDALALAIDDATEQAQFTASKMGVTITGVRFVKVNPGSTGTAMAAAHPVHEGTFLPGKITVRANVEVVFLLGDEDEKE